MNERDRAFFAPLWRRVLITVLVGAWAAFEWVRGDSFWGTLVAAIFAYCVWAFFLNWKDPAPAPAPTERREEP